MIRFIKYIERSNNMIPTSIFYITVILLALVSLKDIYRFKSLLKDIL